MSLHFANSYISTAIAKMATGLIPSPILLAPFLGIRSYLRHNLQTQPTLLPVMNYLIHQKYSDTTLMTHLQNSQLLFYFPNSLGLMDIKAHLNKSKSKYNMLSTQLLLHLHHQALPTLQQNNKAKRKNKSCLAHPQRNH